MKSLACGIVVVMGMIAGCAPHLSGIGGFNREIIEGENREGRYLEPVSRPGLQINKSDNVVVAVQRLPQSIVGGSLATILNKQEVPRILRAWVVVLNYSNHNIRFGPSGVSLVDESHTQLRLISAEALLEAWEMEKGQLAPGCSVLPTAVSQQFRMETRLLREAVVAPHAFAYGFVFFRNPPERKLVFPLRLVVKVGNENLDMEFTEMN